MVAPSTVLPGAALEVYLGDLGPTTNGNPANHVFAVEFDTVLDLEMNDTNDNHIGVDVNSLISNVPKPIAYYTGDGDAGRNTKAVPMMLESAQPI